MPNVSTIAVHALRATYRRAHAIARMMAYHVSLLRRICLSSPQDAARETTSKHNASDEPSREVGPLITAKPSAMRGGEEGDDGW